MDEAGTDPPAPQLADPASLTGQLQRGRGAGFLAALAADRAAVVPVVLRCILEDPRFDQQLESRADYYARLARHVQLPLAPLVAVLQSHTDELAAGYPRLVLPVLACMARRGHAGAAALLVQYLAYGPVWTTAFEALIGDGTAAADVVNLGRIILDRFPSDDAVLAELQRAALDAEAWDRWAAVEPRIAPLLAALRHSTPWPSSESLRAGIDPSWDVATLLAHATHQSAQVIGERAGQRAGDGDVQLLLDALFGDHTARLRAAARALVELRLQECPPRLVRFVEEFDAHDQERLAYYRLNRIRRILAATPAALPMARTWLQADGWARSSVALSILAEQGEAADVPAVLQLLAAGIVHEPGEVGTAYVVEGCLDVLRAFPDLVPYEQAAHVFERTWSTWNRRKAAELMADGHPERFACTYGVECLWDCEAEIVTLGCAYADLSLLTVRERLKALWDSPLEEDAVRKAAGQRLRALQG